jgi:hypothetical protein
VIERDFFRFLARALAALDEEAPDAASALAHSLAGIALEMTVDGESRWLVVRNGRCTLSASGASSAAFRSTREVLVALLEARRTLLDAILCDDLVLSGAPHAVAAIYDAMSAFVQGGMRSRSIARLLDAYLTAGQPCSVTPDSSHDVALEWRTVVATPLQHDDS